MTDERRPDELEDPWWDAVVEGSFPASDPPPGPGTLCGPSTPPPVKREEADDDEHREDSTEA